MVAEEETEAMLEAERARADVAAGRIWDEAERDAALRLEEQSTVIAEHAVEVERERIEEVLEEE